jgi:DNA-binding response OmpR family regulator
MAMKILIADDEEIIRKFIKINLTKQGYDVEEAEDGVQTLERLNESEIHLLICDIMMPNKNGWEVLEEMKSNPKMKDIPIVILTSKNEEADMFKGYDLGASYYMTKPFTKEQLLYGVKLMLGEG